jgi:hypothetical protein
MKQPNLNNMRALLAQPLLQKLAAKTAKLQHWQSLFEANLDDTLKSHCKVADFSAGILKLVIDSPAFATRLRYSQHSLLDNLKKINEFNGLYKIEWLISPIITPAPTSTTPHRLSKESASLLTDMASTCENEELKEVLLRLATRTD